MTSSTSIPSPSTIKLSTNTSTSSIPTALSLRVQKVLATSTFDDPTTRSALDILDRLSQTEQQTNEPSNLPIIDLQNLKKGGLRRLVETRLRFRSRQFLDLFASLNHVRKLCFHFFFSFTLSRCLSSVLKNPLRFLDGGAPFFLLVVHVRVYGLKQKETHFVRN